MPTDKELFNNLLKQMEQSTLNLNKNTTELCKHITTRLNYEGTPKSIAAGCSNISCDECIYHYSNVSRLPQLIENIKQLDALLNN